MASDHERFATVNQGNANADDDSISLEQIATQIIGPSAISQIEQILGKEQHSAVQTPFHGVGPVAHAPGIGLLPDAPGFGPLPVGDLSVRMFLSKVLSKVYPTVLTYGRNETHFKTEKYTPAERREKINKYRAKRNQRNFDKTKIQNVLRKTRAQNMPRIRGRFACVDDVAEAP